MDIRFRFFKKNPDDMPYTQTDDVYMHPRSQ